MRMCAIVPVAPARVAEEDPPRKNDWRLIIRWMRTGLAAGALLCVVVIESASSSNQLSQIQKWPHNRSSSSSSSSQQAIRRVLIDAAVSKAQGVDRTQQQVRDGDGGSTPPPASLQQQQKQSRELESSWGIPPGWTIQTPAPTDAPAWADPGYRFAAPVPAVPNPSPAGGVGAAELGQPVPQFATTQQTFFTPLAPAPAFAAPVGPTAWQPVKGVSSSSAPPPSTLVQPVAAVQQPVVQPVVWTVVRPTVQPNLQPVVQPTARPIPLPTSRPVRPPTARPIPLPTSRPVRPPTSRPISLRPTARPSPLPTAVPVVAPVVQWESQPVPQPVPTRPPTRLPTQLPTRLPTGQPVTAMPTLIPTISPSVVPTASPSNRPSPAASSSAPSRSAAPTDTTTIPTLSQVPTASPTLDRFGTQSSIISNEKGDAGVVDLCRRPSSTNSSLVESIVDQAVVFDYEMRVRPGSDPQLAIDYIATQVHQGLVSDQVKCDWPTGSEDNNGSAIAADKIVSDAPFYVQALSSLPLDLIHPKTADTSCEDTAEYDCYLVDAAVTTRIMTLTRQSRRTLQTQINITDMSFAETMDESLISVFANPGISSGLSSIVSVTYQGLTNAPAGFVSSSDKNAKDSIGIGPLIGAIIGSVLGCCILSCCMCCLWGCLSKYCRGGGRSNGDGDQQSDVKNQPNDRVVFSTEDEDSDEHNHLKNQELSLLDDVDDDDDDDVEFSNSMYLAKQPQEQSRSSSPTPQPQVWYENEVDDDRYFSPSMLQPRKSPSGSNILNDLMRVEGSRSQMNSSPARRRHVLPDTMDL
jgi:hypothetical protein